MKVDEEAATLFAQVDDLARTSTSIDDWCRLETRLRKALLHAEHEQQEELVDVLYLLRLCVQSRIFELEADARHIP